MRIPSDQFWRMSLPEWSASVAGFQNRKGAGATPLARAEFESLMEAYPDG